MLPAPIDSGPGACASNAFEKTVDVVTGVGDGVGVTGVAVGVGDEDGVLVGVGVVGVGVGGNPTRHW